MILFAMAAMMPTLEPPRDVDFCRIPTTHGDETAVISVYKPKPVDPEIVIEPRVWPAKK